MPPKARPRARAACRSASKDWQLGTIRARPTPPRTHADMAAAVEEAAAKAAAQADQRRQPAATTLSRRAAWPAPPPRGEASAWARERDSVMRPSTEGEAAKLRATAAYTEGSTCSSARSSTAASRTAAVVRARCDPAGRRACMLGGAGEGLREFKGLWECALRVSQRSPVPWFPFHPRAWPPRTPNEGSATYII